MNYFAVPVIDGQNTGIPLSPEAEPLEKVLQQVAAKQRAIQAQGFWRDDRGERVPVEYVGFHIVSEKEWAGE